MFTLVSFNTPQRIQRPDRAAPERTITWRERPEFHHFHPEHDSVPVWIDVSKLEAMLPFSRTMEYVGYAGKGGILDKYTGVDEFIRQCRPLKRSKLKIGMPDVRIEPANEKHPDRKTVTIINGRHRFAWMRDHGARALPVAALISEVSEVTQLIGTDERICRVKMLKIPEWMPKWRRLAVAA